MEEVTDKLETLILMALDANHDEAGIDHIERRGRKATGYSEVCDQGQLLKFDTMRPQSAYTFDVADGSRLFATTSDYLVTHPSEILGEETEVVCFGGGLFKWRGFRQLKKTPRGVACFGKASHWYEMHERLVAPSGRGDYIKRLVALDKNGVPLPTQIQGHWVCIPRIEGATLILCASVIEDAHRANTMLAAVKDATEIMFPVPLDDYMDVFSDRDGPMNGARRKAIVHWVAKHLRRSVKRNEHEVKRHTRGVQEFVIDGLRVRLTPNDLKAPNVGDNPPPERSGGNPKRSFGRSG